MGENWDYRFLQLAWSVSGWSKDPSTKTGAVIVGPDKSVVAVGFNGFPQGMPDDDELYNDREEKLSRIVHCEMNALLFAGKLPSGCSLYTVPFMSCDRCAVHMLQAGIRRFVSPTMPEEKAARWKDVMDRAARYIKECQGELVQYDQ